MDTRNYEFIPHEGHTKLSSQLAKLQQPRLPVKAAASIDERTTLAHQLSQLKAPPVAVKLPNGRHSCRRFVLSFPWDTNAQLKYAKRHGLYPDEPSSQAAAARAHLNRLIRVLNPPGVYFSMVKENGLEIDSVTVALNDSPEELRLAEDLDRVLILRDILGAEGCSKWYEARPL